MSEVSDILSQLIGQRIPGGCDDCDAEQIVHDTPGHPGIWRIEIQHDQTCPRYRRLKREGLAW